jgi:hypothetical protein
MIMVDDGTPPPWIEQFANLVGQHLDSQHPIEWQAWRHAGADPAWHLDVYPTVFLESGGGGEHYSPYAIHVDALEGLFDMEPTVVADPEGVSFEGRYACNEVHLLIHFEPAEDSKPIGEFDKETDTVKLREGLGEEKPPTLN